MRIFCENILHSFHLFHKLPSLPLANSQKGAHFFHKKQAWALGFIKEWRLTSSASADVYENPMLRVKGVWMTTPCWWISRSRVSAADLPSGKASSTRSVNLQLASTWVIPDSGRLAAVARALPEWSCFRKEKALNADCTQRWRGCSLA